MENEHIHFCLSIILNKRNEFITGTKSIMPGRRSQEHETVSGVCNVSGCPLEVPLVALLENKLPGFYGTLFTGTCHCVISISHSHTLLY